MFVLKNPLGENESKLNEDILRQNGYYTVVQALYEVLIQRKYEKLMTVWIQGQPNTGKTCITKMIDDIFICDVL